MANHRHHSDTDHPRRAHEARRHGRDVDPWYEHENPDPLSFEQPGYDPTPFEREDFRPYREAGAGYAPPAFGPMATGLGVYPMFPGGYPRSRYDYAYNRRPGYMHRPHYGQGRAFQGREGRDFFDKAGDEVQSWFGDEEAAMRRERDQQQGEHRGRGPKGYTRSDNRIHEDVCDRLFEDSWIDATQLEVNVEKGEVTLSGHVHSKSDKRRAEDLTDEVSGVGHVQNNLRVITEPHEDHASGSNHNGTAH